MMEKIKNFFKYDSSLTSYIGEDGKKITLFSLALPIFFESVLRTLLNTVNSTVLSRFTETAAGAIGTATTILNFMTMLFSMISTGVTVIIVQNLGAGNRKRAGEAATLSVVFCTTASLIVGIIASAFAKELMLFMNLEGQQLQEAIEYFEIVSGFNFISALIIVFSAITRSYGRTRYNFIVALIMNALNAAFCSIVVFRPFETPLYGISGVAIARISAEAIACIINIVLVARMKIGFTIKAALRPKLDLIKQVFKYGVPAGVGGFSYSISTMLSTAIIGGFGTLAVTTKAYLSSITFYSALISSSMGMATSILIGRNVGRGDMEKAYKLCIQSMKVAILSNASFSAVLACCAGPIFRFLFNASDEVVALAQGIMFVDIFVEIGRAMNNVEDNALRSSGDVIYQMAIGLSSCWALSVFFSLVLGKWCGLGLYGCWIAFAMDECGRGLMYFIRWKGKKWMTKRIIRDEEVEKAS